MQCLDRVAEDSRCPVMGSSSVFVGTAGWSIASRHAEDFPGPGTHLERYGRCLDCVEINSSFYRPHRRETYERWACSVPENFRFSVKLPRSITHEARLVGCEEALDRFLTEASGLGKKFSVILVQTPPSLRCLADEAEAFFKLLRDKTDLAVAFEPRHASWFAPEVDAMLEDCRIARVAADPAPVEGAGQPAGWSGLAYFRLHGTPRIYWSDYPEERLREIRRQLDEANNAGAQVWCIFDNTAESHALANAATVAAMKGETGCNRPRRLSRVGRQRQDRAGARRDRAGTGPAGA